MSGRLQAIVTDDRVEVYWIENESITRKWVSDTGESGAIETVLGDLRLVFEAAKEVAGGRSES